MSEIKINPYENLKKIVDEVAKILNLNQGLTEILKFPKKIIIVNFPVKMDDGTVKVFTGYRVKYLNSYGSYTGRPYKGGIRFHPKVDLDEVIALAGWMFFKTSVMDLELGGAKGGIQCDPKHMSLGEKERMTRAFVQAIRNEIGPFIDVPAPDVYTNAQIMSWIVDEFSNLFPGQNNLGVVTGKPVELGGSLGRGTATARGGDFVLEYLSEISNKKYETVVIQGFGNAGRHFAEFADNRGMKIIAASDSKGSIYDPNGIDLNILKKIKDEKGSVIFYTGSNVKIVKAKSDNEHNEWLLSLPCDILVPAALENQITEVNAENIQAKIILELANGPTTPEADKILTNKGIIILPDILANAGGVTVSHFEWEQNVQAKSWTAEAVEIELRKKMRENTEEVFKRAKKYGVNNRLAAYILAIERAAKRMSLRCSETISK